MENQDLAFLHVDSDTAELRYLVCMAQSFELSFVKSFCNVFFIEFGLIEALNFLFHVEIST